MVKFSLIQLQSVCSVHTRLLHSVFLSNKNLLFSFTRINSTGDDGKEFYLTCKGCFEKLRLPFNMRDATLWMLQMDQSYVKATKARKRQRPTLYPSIMNPRQFFFLNNFWCFNTKAKPEVCFLFLSLFSNRRSTSAKKLQNQYSDADFLSNKHTSIVGPLCTLTCDLFKPISYSSTFNCVILTNSLLFLNLKWRK